MAEENNDQALPGAIPPKAVPPQIRSAAEGHTDSPTVRHQAVSQPGAAPTPVPRTVRLKPISVSSADALPAGGGSAAAAAAEAVKRMTARISMLADETDAGKKRTGQIPVGGAAGGKTETAPISAFAVSDVEATVKKVTSRIQMSSATGPIPELPNAPLTIKIRSQSPGQTGVVSQPGVIGELSAAAGQSGTQPSSGKAKTSRIPLESAMSVQQSSAATQENPAGTAPKTIKLKRPGEMSTVKVSLHGGVSAPADSAPDNAPITQKKTIRVKRPTVPAAASVSEGGDEAGGHSAATPMAFAPLTPERGTGWFIACSVVCILLIIGLAGLFAIQLFGSRPHTELDPQYQKG
ncbi:MAG: hypothetical protein ACOYOU_06960 [Kiritimatiellia bacterium]